MLLGLWLCSFSTLRGIAILDTISEIAGLAITAVHHHQETGAKVSLSGAGVFLSK